MAQVWKWDSVERAIKMLDRNCKGGWFSAEQVANVSNKKLRSDSTNVANRVSAGTASIILRAWANPDIHLLGMGGPFVEVRRVDSSGKVIGTPSQRTNQRGLNQYRWMGGNKAAWKPRR